MKALTVVSLLCVAAAVTANAAALRTSSSSSQTDTTPLKGPFASGWKDMFDPPYQNNPSIMLGIACMDDANCYVPAGSNGVGFRMMAWHGVARNNYNFTPLQQTQMMMMMMAVDAQGSFRNPRGAVAGFGFGDGIQYFTNSTTMLPSKGQPLVAPAQDLRVVNNRDILIAAQAEANDTFAILISHDAGATVTLKALTGVNMNGNATVRYCSFGGNDGNTLYVTLGSWPDNNNNINNKRTVYKKMRLSHQLSARVTLEQDLTTGEVKRISKLPERIGGLKPMAAASRMSTSTTVGTPGYAASIIKSTDGGNTWHTLLNTQDNYYLNAIDCIAPTHCVAVGEGFDDDAGARIFLSTDGNTFQQVLFMKSNNKCHYSLMSVRFSGKSEVWAAGSCMGDYMTTSALFLQSVDGGRTWKDHSGTLKGVADVTDMSFNKESGVGFASAVTVYQVSTLLRYDSH